VGLNLRVENAQRPVDGGKIGDNASSPPFSQFQPAG
jgi:hypothetical protein